ncbi:MAG: hypothetical protein MUQ56_12720, partial [Thermoleophilia bacterium]|nr:hypothetical protein [Thermoleophilia bacterium]
MVEVVVEEAAGAEVTVVTEDGAVDAGATGVGVETVVAAPPPVVVDDEAESGAVASDARLGGGRWLGARDVTVVGAAVTTTSAPVEGADDPPQPQSEADARTSMAPCVTTNRTRAPRGRTRTLFLRGGSAS